MRTAAATALAFALIASCVQAATIAGTWTVQLMSHQIGLVLEQDGTHVTGTMMLGGRDLEVEGQFKESTLTFETKLPADHAGAAETGSMKFTGTLKADGTLAGTMRSPRGESPWTAERLKGHR